MSDQDFFFDDDKPAEPVKAPAKSGKASGKSTVKKPPAKPARKPAPKAASAPAASVSLQQSVPLLVTILVAALTLLLGIIIGILVSPSLAPSSTTVGAPVDNTGVTNMGMGGGGTQARPLTPEEIEQGMPAGHVPVGGDEAEGGTDDGAAPEAEPETEAE